MNLREIGDELGVTNQHADMTKAMRRIRVLAGSRVQGALVA